MDWVKFVFQSSNQRSGYLQRANRPTEAFDEYAVWVQLHNLPMAFKHPKIIKSIGGRLGRVCEVDTDDSGQCVGKFARVRVNRYLHNPL